MLAEELERRLSVYYSQECVYKRDLRPWLLVAWVACLDEMASVKSYLYKVCLALKSFLCREFL